MLNNYTGKSIPKDFLGIPERCYAGCKRKDCFLAAMNFTKHRITGTSVEGKSHKERAARRGTEIGTRCCCPRADFLRGTDRTAGFSTPAFLSLCERPYSLGDHRSTGFRLHPSREKEIELAYRMTQQFIHLLKKKQGNSSTAWISICSSCGIAELEAFALGLQKELPAFQAACSLPYSNGMTEGFVNKLKFIKRSMYGRGSFALLRQRMLQSAA